MRENWLDDELNKLFDDYDSDINLEAEWNALQERRQKDKRPSLLWILFLGFAVAAGSWYIYSSSSTTMVVSDAEPSTATEDLPITQSLNSQTPNTQSEIALIKNTQTENTRGLNTKIVNSQNSLKEDKVAEFKKPNVQNAKSSLSSTTVSSLPTQAQASNINQSQSKTSNYALTTQKNIVIGLDDVSKFVKEIVFMPLLPTYLEIDRSLIEGFAENNNRTRKTSSRAGNQYLGFTFGYSPLTKGSILEDEKAIDGFSSSISFKKYLSPKFYLATGLGLDHFSTQLTGKSQYSYTQLEDNQLIERYINSDGTIDDVYGIGEVAVTETSTFQLYNRYKFISVPVIFGVQLYEKAQSHLELEAGVSASFVSQYELKYFDGINQFKNYDNLDLRESGVFNGITNLTWHYQPQSMDRLDFFFRLGARLQLNDITREKIIDSKRFQSFTLGFGAEYSL